jgi:hypothetical protein
MEENNYLNHERKTLGVVGEMKQLILPGHCQWLPGGGARFEKQARI